MESRKIQKVGRSTLSISLPKKWTNLMGLNHGDVLHVDPGKDGVLRLYTKDLIEKRDEPKEYFINCDITTEPCLLERLIVGCYMLGVDVIKIFSSSRIVGKQIEEVRNIARSLIGFSIIEESRNEIILQCAIDPFKFQIHPLVQRLSVITSTMFNEAMEALLNLNSELAHDVIKREDEANHIYWLITRLVLSAQTSELLAEKIGLYEPLGPTGIRLTSKNLEGIADCSEEIAKLALELIKMRDTIDKKEMEKMLPLNQLAKEVFQKAVDSLFCRDVLLANEAINLRTKLVSEIEARMRMARIPYFRAICIMMAIIAERSASVATVAINNEVSKYTSFPHLGPVKEASSVG